MATNYPESLRIGKKSAIDDRYGKWDAATASQIPYISVAEANSMIASAERYQGLTVFIKLGTNIAQEYWYRDGITDQSLIPKNNWIILSASTDANYTLPAGNMIHGFVLKAAGAVPAFKIGTAGAGSDNVTGGAVPLAANVSFPLWVPLFADADTVLSFSGFNGTQVTITLLKP